MLLELIIINRFPHIFSWAHRFETKAWVVLIICTFLSVREIWQTAKPIPNFSSSSLKIHNNTSISTYITCHFTTKSLRSVWELHWLSNFPINTFLVSKETVVLRKWERSKQKFGFIKRVDKGEITTVKDLESWRFER